MKKSEELAKKLGQSLSLTKQKTDNENKAKIENVKLVQKPIKENPVKKEVKKQVVKVEETSTLERIAVSLYETDVKKANEIQVFMLQNGKRVSRSDAVKLALRSTKINDDLLKVFRQVKAEDRRRKPAI